MPFRRSVLLVTFVAMVLAVMTPAAFADSFSAVVVYGDSLSDNGNLYKATGGLLPASPPYYQGRYSNGPVAVEQLASKLNAPLFDFAFAGATSGVGNYGDGGTQTSLGSFNLPGMLTELAGSAPYLGALDLSSSLFVVWGGANDYLINGSPIIAAADITAIVKTLQSYGVKNILVPGLPDLGQTPDYLGVADATAYSLKFNSFLQASLPSGATYVDTFSLLNSITSNPSAYGLTDVTDPCLDVTKQTICSNPNQYLFWDGFHPTAAVDAIVASTFVNSALPTPEPSSFLLLGSGLTSLGVVARRGRRKLVASQGNA